MESLLKKGEYIEWKIGNLVCIVRDKKYRLELVNGRRGALYNERNKWLFKEKFDFISSPNKLISIFRVNGTSRLINIPSGEYLTKANLYVKCHIIGNEYLVEDNLGVKEKIIIAKRGK